ncbi:MAG: hypothetical protein WBS19_18790 [Candidatus Korobacteraceae bacterium]
MSEKFEQVKAAVDKLERSDLVRLAEYLREKTPRHSLEQAWKIRAELILDSIQRSQDITKRGIRGIIAECVFEKDVLPKAAGWQPVDEKGDLPYDFKVQNEKQVEVKIQVKLQRMEKGQPLSANDQKKIFPKDYWIVEVQKTRSGQAIVEESIPLADVLLDESSESETTGQKPPPKKVSTTSTRPYKFGEFDILAVSLQPSTGNWTKFMYTVASWLLERPTDPALIEIMQPVSPVADGSWTDDLATCIEWLLGGEKKKIFNVEEAAKFLEAERERIRAERIERSKQEKGAAKAADKAK